MDGLSFTIGLLAGAFGMVFILAAVGSIQEDAAREECQAKLAAAECVRKVEWIAKQ